MRKFPFYPQLDQMDCGPSCLRMIAKHFGKHYTIQTLRDKAQIGKNGVTLLGIAEAAESIGFRSLGAKISFDKLVNETPLPCIVHWDQNHFIVVYAIRTTNLKRYINLFFNFFANFFVTKKLNIEESDINKKNKNYYLHVADPGRGLVSYSGEEFCQSWLSSFNEKRTEGIVLLLEPTAAFYEEESEKKNIYTLERVITYLIQYKKLFLQLGLGLLVSSALQLIFPFLTQSIVDIGINTLNRSFIYLVLTAQLMLMVGRLSIEFVRSWLLLHISTRVNLSILSDFLIKLIRLPISFFDAKQFGDIMQRVGDHHRIEAFLTNQTISIIFSLFNLFVLSVVLALFNLTIFSIFIASSILYIGWIVLFLKQRRKLDYKRFEASAMNQNSLIQIIQGMQEIKLAGAERTMRWTWERLQAKLFKLQMKGLALSQYQQAGAFAIHEAKNIFITFLAANAVIKGNLTLGAMLAMQQIIGQLNAPIEQLIGFIQSLQDAKISLERLNEVHTLQDEEIELSLSINSWEDFGYQNFDYFRINYSLNEDSNTTFAHPVLHKEYNYDIQAKNIFFKYPGAGNSNVINNVNFTILSGKTTAIVGTSGSGKTTLLKLLLKFYHPVNGEIVIGKTSLRNVSHSFWRSQCGVVMQESFIFSDSIARNIAVGVDHIDANKLEHAIYIANLNEFVNSLPLGMHTKIGLEGNGISQGQKQRILIARAVYKNPKYIFFDEATNSLDANNEHIIMNNLNSFFVGRTVLVVAHRLSTVRNADQIIVMNMGSITEVGTHEELIKRRGEYWCLVKNQLDLEV